MRFPTQIPGAQLLSHRKNVPLRRRVRGLMLAGSPAPTVFRDHIARLGVRVFAVPSMERTPLPAPISPCIVKRPTVREPSLGTLLSKTQFKGNVVHA